MRNATMETETLHTYETAKGPIEITIDDQDVLRFHSPVANETLETFGMEIPASFFHDFGVDPTPVFNAIGLRAIVREQARRKAKAPSESLHLALTEAGIGHGIHVSAAGEVVVELDAAAAAEVLKLIERSAQVRRVGVRG